MKIPAVAKAVGYFHEDLIAEAMEDKIQRKPIPWKKWTAIAACLAAVLAVIAIGNVMENLTLVHRGEDYTIKRGNDGYYLVSRKVTWADFGWNGVGLAPPGYTQIYFLSTGEMKEFLLKGDFTLEQLYTIQSFEKNRNGDIAMLDLQKIWEPKLPEGMRTARVIWRGVNYEYWIADGRQQGTLSVLSQKKFAEAKEQHAVESSQGVIVEKHTMDGFEITVQWQYGGKTVDIFGEGNGIYFHGHLVNFSQAADMEWLKGIGLQLYTDTAAE